MSKTCINRSDSLIFQHKRRPLVIGFTYAFSGVHFRSNESQTFHRSIMTADDSIKCRCANSGMTGQVGGFQNPGVCLQAFPSLVSSPPLLALLLAPFFARSLTLVSRSLFLNRTETLATQATYFDGTHLSHVYNFDCISFLMAITLQQNCTCLILQHLTSDKLLDSRVAN